MSNIHSYKMVAFVVRPKVEGKVAAIGNTSGTHVCTVMRSLWKSVGFGFSGMVRGSSVQVESGVQSTSLQCLCGVS